MAEKFIIFDTGNFQTLFEIDGLSGIEHIFDRGLSVVIPNDIYREIGRAESLESVREWIDGDDRFIRPDYDDPAAARRAFQEGAITQAELDAASKNAGDRAIKALASGRELDGNNLSDRPNQAAIHAANAGERALIELTSGRKVVSFGNGHLWREVKLRRPHFFLSDDLHAEIVRQGLRVPKTDQLKEV